MSMDSFAGRVAIVTGGSGGIGAAVCTALLARGARVASLSRSKGPTGTESVHCDVTSEDDVARAVGEVEARLGPAELLVCSAGIVSERPVAELTLTDWRQVLDVSLTGTFLTCRAVLPAMLRARRGRIVALSSGYATKGYRNGAHYAAAKAGIEAFVKSLALEVAESGITVNAVSPGPVETAMLDHFDEGRRERTAGLIPQGRIGGPDDIVGPVLFLLGAESRYMTGQVLQVNGGMLMP